MDTNHEKVPEIKIEQGTPEDYNRRAEFWERTEKKIQSDFLCRPYVYELLGDIKDRAVVDIGCGDGFVSRHLAREGARVVGLDNSEGQIDKAIARETKEGLGINYLVGDARELPMRDESVDSAVSVLVYGHFPKSEMIKAIQETYRVLKPGGTFVVAVPHPETYLKKSKSNWIKFNYDNLKDGDDQRANITLYNSDGRSFTIDAWVQRYQTYFDSLRENGFEVETSVEPLPTDEDLTTYPQMWGEDEKSKVVHEYLIIRARKLSKTKSL